MHKKISASWTSLPLKTVEPRCTETTLLNYRFT